MADQAETPFFAMSQTSSAKTSKERSCDNNYDILTEVPDSIQVVKDILTENEVDKDHFSETDADNESSNGDLTFVTCLESERLLKKDAIDECRECKCIRRFLEKSKYTGTQASLGVDVHHEGCAADVESRCIKNTTESFHRCNPKTHRQRDVESPLISEPTDLFLSDVKFYIWDEQASEGSSDDEDIKNIRRLDECDFENFKYAPHTLLTSLPNGACLPVSMPHSSSTTSMPICRICQLPSKEPANPLISPCRCLGSIRYIHSICLMKWLEVSSNKNCNPPGCELCQYPYIRHKKFKISNWLVPSCSSKDKILHSVFMVAITVMIICSLVILCFKQNGDIYPRVSLDAELSTSELVTLSCGVLFFLSFFVAMYVEVKADNKIYQLLCKLLYMYHEWTIEEYDPSKDPTKKVDSP